MNSSLFTRRLSGVLLALAVFASAPILHASPGRPIAYSLEQAGRYVERGTPRIQVLAKLGRPMERLGEDIWLYRGIEPAPGYEADVSCRTLMITFRDGMVARLQLVNGPMVDRVAAEQRRAESAPVVASTGPKPQP
ncbi:MAG: hypothetical protein IAE82_10005 [Opitutaceae bacterium]|nr:hypothetical protein [Opitutaceae bacterium]